MHADAVIVAAGSSTRFGTEDKLFADLCGRPVLAWPLSAFEAAATIERIVVVCAPEAVERVSELGRAFAPSKFTTAVEGGARRRDSVEAGLRATRARYAAIHDGARPLVTSALINAVVTAAAGGKGAIAAVVVTDTIKEVATGLVTGHPERTALWAAQTPQVVLRQAWLDAAAAGDGDETDDAAMLARLGLECVAVEGSVENIKITRLLDLALARLILEGRLKA